MHTVAIVGTGLIGASFGLALRKAGFRGRIAGVSSPPAAREALACGAIDEAVPLEQAAAEAGLIYLSQTIGRILETIPLLDRLARPEALITDAGSTKSEIVTLARRTIRRAQFLGGHPLAGKEKRGAAEADPDLFAGRTYVLTPTEPSELETPAARDFLDWLGKIGATPVVVPPEEHDRIVAFTSHLPQLVSTALGSMLADVEHLSIAGPGLADALRLAASPYEVWGDILKTNRRAIEAALDAYLAALQAIREELDDAHGAFERANAFRRSWGKL